MNILVQKESYLAVPVDIYMCHTPKLAAFLLDVLGNLFVPIWTCFSAAKRDETSASLQCEFQAVHAERASVSQRLLTDL